MLNPRDDRLEFRELFLPEEGYCLDFAIGTTYSCDLEALVGACLTFGLLADPDDDVKRNAVSCLRAIRAATGRLALFCQAGQILRAPKASPIYSLLEETVFQVCPAKKGQFWPSFHPKVWLARYEAQKKKAEGALPCYYRLVVQSRNLTFDRSWDIGCALTGKPGKPGRTNQPLIDFVSFLASQKTCDGSPKRKRMQKMLDELRRIEFKPDSQQFSELKFIPMGIPGYEKAMLAAPLLEGWPRGDGSSCDDLLIISPFLGKKALRYFCEKNTSGKRVLVTRASSLPVVKDLPLERFRIYTLRNDVIDAELDGEEVGGREIHAKIYFQSFGKNAYLWLGSMNASYKAICENVEFMCCLYCKKHHLGWLTKEFLPDDKLEDPHKPFQELSPTELAALPEPEADVDDSFLRELAASGPRVKILKEGKEFRPLLRLEKCPKLPEGYELKLAPLLCDEWLPLASEMKFGVAPLLKLSAFYRARLAAGDKTCERVLKIPTDDMPEERDQVIVREIVKGGQALYTYLAFLLGDNSLRTMLELTKSAKGGAGSGTHGVAVGNLYEKLLRAAYENPEKFTEIEELATTLGEENLPEDFVKLWAQFRKIVKKPS